MKRPLVFLLLFLQILPAVSLAAGRNLPEEIRNVFRTAEWEGYAIPAMPEGTPYGGLSASYYDSENNRTTAIVMIIRDDISTLCILEKENGVWFVAAQSSTAVKQNGGIPFVSGEVYNEFYIDYPRPDGQPDLGITVQKENARWIVTEIRCFPRDRYICVQIGENELRYTGDETNWEPVAVQGMIENNLDLLILDDFPMTVEAARTMLPAN